MIKEHERVVLTVAVPDERLEAGDVGTVVHVYRDGQANEVEFVALDGHTAAVAIGAGVDQKRCADPSTAC
jgi:hypothetical protein